MLDSKYIVGFFVGLGGLPVLGFLFSVVRSYRFRAKQRQEQIAAAMKRDQEAFLERIEKTLSAFLAPKELP